MTRLFALHPITGAAVAALSPLASSSPRSSLPLLHLSVFDPGRSLRFLAVASGAKPNKPSETLQKPLELAGAAGESIDFNDLAEGEESGLSFSPDLMEDGEGEGDAEGFSSSSTEYGARGDERDYDRDPEFAEILGSFFDDPEKAQSRIEERIRSKRSKILQTKTGSATPIKVTFNKFDYSNSYIWFEFYNAPLPKDITLICDTIRSWHIVGRLGGCNSMNMQLSQTAHESKRPSYDAIQGANVTPTSFYNIGDLEIQDNLARIWVDIGTSEPLLLDVLINALTCISTDYVGIKEVVFGGSEFENWKENLTDEEAGYSAHKI